MRTLVTGLAVLVMFFCAGLASAEETANYKGWERSGRFNALYQPDGYTTLKGEVERFFKVTPLPGMVEGLGMRVKLRDGSLVDIILAPVAYVDFLSRVFHPGELAKIKGAWTEIDGRRWFVASKVRLREMFEVKLRGTRSGVPYWDMSMKELEAAESD